MHPAILLTCIDKFRRRAVNDMEQYPIKSVTFGGFDKQDVVRYIEQAANENRQLQSEKLDLQNHLNTAREELENLRTELAGARALQDQLQAQVLALEPFKAEVESLRSEVKQLRGDAETYRQIKTHLGDIECEAQKRADHLENETLQQLQQTTDLFRARYQTLMNTFETAANHVTGELRKMEVNLSQLPRAMDQSGAELNELAAVLERKKKGE